MKAKLIILAAIAVVILHSCANDRDDDVKNETIKKVNNSNQENFKLNTDIQSVLQKSSIKNDTIRMLDSADVNELPADGGDPKDVPVPPRR
ncbi:hypothetical protein [Chryseobacterium sp.]|uniref:hypothetical protein n=1 Tax=Chryseobacterium sp. TaxID=1871047 RepID=UPI003219CC92